MLNRAINHESNSAADVDDEKQIAGRLLTQLLGEVGLMREFLHEVQALGARFVRLEGLVFAHKHELMSLERAFRGENTQSNRDHLSVDNATIPPRPTRRPDRDDYGNPRPV